MSVLAIGHDVVDVAAFAEQLAAPGSRMEQLFSLRERRQAAALAHAKHDARDVHLSAKWAGKESVVKAWCAAVGQDDYPYTMEGFPWDGVEIIDDGRGRPQVVLRNDVQAALNASVSVSIRPGSTPVLRWHISLSHDGPVASAMVILER